MLQSGASTVGLEGFMILKTEKLEFFSKLLH